MKGCHTYIAAITALCFLVMIPAVSFGQEEDLARMEQRLFELINAARANPLDMASRIGLDPDRVLADLPWLYDILTGGLPPLRSEVHLTRSARAHTRDMFDADYYGYDSPDGKTPDVRIRESGYTPERWGETLGMIGFFNFIDIEHAVQRIFSTLYTDELNPGRTRPRNILNPDLPDVGIGFGAGKLTIQGIPYNAYAVTCDFGSPTYALELLELVNQLRARPYETVRSLGLDPDALIEAHPQLYAALTTPLPPLIPDDSLNAAAKSHTRDMLENHFIGSLSSDGRTAENRMTDAGYVPAASGEKIHLVGASEDVPISEAVFELLRHMVDNEIENYLNFGALTMLNPDLTNIGIGMQTGRFPFDSGSADILLLTADLATRAEGRPLHIAGVVYADSDGDGLYTPGEGISGIPVTLERMNTPFGFLESDELLTNAAGGFASPAVKPGLQHLTVRMPGSEPTEYWITVFDQSVRIENRLQDQ